MVERYQRCVNVNGGDLNKEIKKLFLSVVLQYSSLSFKTICTIKEIVIIENFIN